MTLKNYLIVMGVLTAVCWGIFLFVANMINPETTNWLGFLLFYAALFLSVAGSAALLGFVVRFKMLRHELAFRVVKLAFKQAFIFSLFIVVLFILLAQNIFTWLNLLLLIIIFGIWEFFSSHKKQASN